MSAQSTAASDPDAVARRDRRQAIDLRQRIQYGFAAGNWEGIELRAISGAIGDDVVTLAVVRDHIDKHLHSFRLLLGNLSNEGSDTFAGLIARQAGDLHRAVNAEHHRAIGPHEVLPIDRLRAERL